VLYQGVVPHEEIPEWLNAADIFVLPTLDEGCSNAILEALFCGLPVISSDLPFNHGILDEQTAILVDPGDVRALGQTITWLLKQPERRAAMSQAALQRSQAFRLADRARSIVTFLRSLC
jgi:glycosyltransferase involved in cell wall biosynthesis